MKEEVFEDFITTEIDGITHKGKRTIKGKRVKYQTITYLDNQEPDSKMYEMDRQHLMDGFAKIILNQLVRKIHSL